MVGRGWVLVIVTVWCATFGGCSKGKEIPTDLVPVTGTVTLDGEPVAGALVTYIPTGTKTEGVFDAAGETDEQGKYKLMTSEGQAEGATPGEYRVVISKLVKADGSTAKPTKDKSPMQLMLEGAKEVVHPDYSDLAFSKLKATVPQGGGTNDFPLNSGGMAAGTGKK